MSPPCRCGRWCPDIGLRGRRPAWRSNSTPKQKEAEENPIEKRVVEQIVNDTEIERSAAAGTTAESGDEASRTLAEVIARLDRLERAVQPIANTGPSNG